MDGRGYGQNGRYKAVHLREHLRVRRAEENRCVNQDALDFIMNELKAMRTEIQELKDTVCDVSNVFTHMRESTEKMIHVAVEKVALNFENRMVELDKQMDTQTESIVMIKKNIAKTVNDNCNIVSSMETQLKESVNQVTHFEDKMIEIAEQVVKKKEHILMTKEDAKKQAQSIESNNAKVISMEAQLKEGLKREKLAKSRLIHLETKERKNNLMFFGVQEDANVAVEHSLQVHLKQLLNAETPSIIYNTKRVGVKSSLNNSPRPIVTTFADPLQRLNVWKKRYNLVKPFGISEDLPKEVRFARTCLVPQMKKLKEEGQNAGIIYPAILKSENRVIREIDISEVVL